MKTFKTWLGAAALGLLATVASTEAQDKPAEKPADKPAETAPAKPADKPKDAPPKLSAGSDGFAIQSDNGDYKIQIRGYAHFDGRFFPGDDKKLAVDSFLLRRVRPIVQGTVGKYFEFNITPDFGGGTTVLQDAFIDFKYSPKARIKVGKFKSPVGLERLQSATAITFVERAYPTALLPNRDVGIQLHGELAGGVVAYAVGYFDGAPDGGSVDLDVNDGKDFAGRVFFSPFKKGDSALKDLGFGVSGTTGNQVGALPAYRSGGQISILTLVTGVTADGDRQRYSPQLSFYTGPFGLLAEYAHTESDLKKADGTRGTFEAEAWQATASIALTADKASFGGVRPAKPFDPSKGQWGAVELAARVNELKIGNKTRATGILDPTKSIQKAFAWAVGINWSLNRNIKQVFDYERTSFTGGAAVGDRDSESALFIRTQVSF